MNRPATTHPLRISSRVRPVGARGRCACSHLRTPQVSLPNRPNFRSNSTGKERDEETGYSYFSARYLDHNLLTGFLSVDRYADKYPTISPYTYCAWNPLRLIDPSGDTIIFDGDKNLIRYAVENMQKRTENLKLEVDNRGVVSCSGKAVTDEEVYMEEIIKSSQVKVNVQVQRTNWISNDKEIDEGSTDAFMGNTIRKDKNGNWIASADQIVNVLAVRDVDRPESGDLMWHAVSEGYEGALYCISRQRGCSSSKKDSDYMHCYTIAHNRANAHNFPGDLQGFGFDIEHMIYRKKR